MVEHSKKSTNAVREIVFGEKDDRVWLDSRLALFGEKDRWLALGDLHFGYEVSRRAAGGLWPLWGRETLSERLDELIADYEPATLILNGDIVDSSAGGRTEAIQWLEGLASQCGELVLIHGNHDRGAVVRQFEFVDHYWVGPFLFHHGHLPAPASLKDSIEVIGHHHPAVRFADGAGLSMKLPALVQEKRRWILPAFSPWAGGTHFRSECESARIWACGRGRIIPCGA